MNAFYNDKIQNNAAYYSPISLNYKINIIIGLMKKRPYVDHILYKFLIRKH